jgi:hypothetical protein
MNKHEYPNRPRAPAIETANEFAADVIAGSKRQAEKPAAEIFL